MFLFVSGCGNLLLSELQGPLGSEESEVELADEILLTRGDQTAIRQQPSGLKFVSATPKRENLTRQAAILPKVGHVLPGGLRAPLRC